MGSAETMQAALDGYERRLSARGVPVDRMLLPGLTDTEIDRVTADLPFRLSDEARTFYRWHNGSREEPNGPGDETYVPGATYLSPLDWVVRDYAEWRHYEPGRFREMWIPLNSRDGRTIIVDCGVRPDEPSPIYFADSKDSAPWGQVCSPSFANVIDVWNHVLDEDYWTYDRVKGEWTERYRSIPLELRHRHIV